MYFAAVDANKIGRKVALWSFGIGTTIFLTFKLTEFYLLAFIGFAFLIVAGLLNIFILFVVISDIFVSKTLGKNLLTMGIILLNIPIANQYMNWVGDLGLDIEHIPVMFANHTSKTIEKIEVYDGDSLLNTITDLKPEEDFTQKFDAYKNSNAAIYFFIDGKLHSNIDLFNCNANKAAEQYKNGVVIYRIGIDSVICSLSFRGD